MKFDKKLQNLRKASGLSQEDLASELGVSRQSVSKWESGSSYPEMDKLILMTKIFKCSLDDLVNDEATDIEIMKSKNSKANTYIDSLLDFITKSINMFSSMKFSSVIKCFIELFIIAFVIFIVILFCNSIAEELIYSILSFAPYQINNFLSSIVLLILIALAVIVFFQVYKVRYLDYYDKLIYEYEQRKELNVNKQNKKGINELDKIKKEEEKKARIIIRDPSHRPLAFLSALSHIILAIIKGLILFLSFAFVILLIGLVVLLVLSLYLVFTNSIFFGVILGIVGAIIITIEVLILVFDFIFDRKIPVLKLFIIFLVSIIVSSIGLGLSIIKLKDFKYIDNVDGVEQYSTIVKEYEFNDELFITNIYGNHIFYEIDDSLENIKLEIGYSKIFSKISLYEYKSRITIDYTNNEINFSEIVNLLLDDFSKNIIRDYDNFSYPVVIVKANEKNIKKLIKNVSQDYHLMVYNLDDGYEVYFQEIIVEDKICELTSDDYYNCVGIELHRSVNKEEFDYELKNNSLIYDNSKYYCYYDSYENGYNCYDRAEYDY